MLKHPPLKRNPLFFGAVALIALWTLIAGVTYRLSGERTPVTNNDRTVEATTGHSITLVANPATEESKAVNSEEPSEPTGPSELELLNRIRGQIGSPLEGSSFLDAAETPEGEPAGFDEAYSKASQNADAAKPLWQRPDSSYVPPAEPEVTYRQALRDAARVLDEGAANLEDANAFEQADALRQRADQLRELARQSLEAGES
mgnify:FL=1